MHLTLGCLGFLNQMSDSVAAEMATKVPVVYSVSRGTYTTPEGRSVVLDWSIHQPLTPYPNVVWNQSKQAYQTLDGSPVPRVSTQHGASGIPVEAIDPYWGVSGNGKRLKSEMSDEGRKAGKIPVYYDPNRYGYFDSADRPMQSWSVATHELVEPKPNVVWDSINQEYITRDGSPLPWIKDSRGWEGIPVEAIDPAMGAYSPGVYSAKRGSPKPEVQVAEYSKQIGAHKQITNMKALMDNLFQRGVKVSPNVLQYLKQLEMGSEGKLKEMLPDAGKSLQQMIDATKEKASPPPAARKIRPLTVFNIRPEEVAAARQQALAQSQPQFRGNALREMEQLNADMANTAASGQVSDAGNQAFFNRYLDISQRMAGELNSYSSSMGNWNQINQMRAQQEDISRMMRAARAGDAGAVSSAAIGLMDKLPASIGKPAKTFIERMQSNSSRKAGPRDPLTGRTDLDEESHAATADLFADLIKSNPDGRDYILAEMARVDAVNDFVHGMTQEVEQLIDEQYQQYVKEVRPKLQEQATRPIEQLTPPALTGDRKKDEQALASHSISQQQMKNNKEYDVERLTQFEKNVDFHNRSRDAREAWYQSHRLGAMVAARVTPEAQQPVKPGFADAEIANPAVGKIKVGNHRAKTGILNLAQGNIDKLISKYADTLAAKPDGTRAAFPSAFPLKEGWSPWNRMKSANGGVQSDFDVAIWKGNYLLGGDGPTSMAIRNRSNKDSILNFRYQTTSLQGRNDGVWQTQSIRIKAGETWSPSLSFLAWDMSIPELLSVGHSVE